MTHRAYCDPDCPVCTALRRGAIDATAESGIESVDARALAAAARVPESFVVGHGARSVPGWIAEAYADSTDSLQADFRLRFASADSWREGLRRATEGLVETLAHDPARARFCYVEVLRGGSMLRLLREQVRSRSIALFAEQYESHYGTGDVPLVMVELACNAIIHTIATHASARRVAHLPHAVDAMLAAAEACEPLPGG